MKGRQLLLPILLFLVAFSGSVTAQTAPPVSSAQKTIDRVTLMPNIPTPFEMRDWDAVARGYDELFFDFQAEGQYLPLIKWDKRQVNFRLPNFFVPSYVGIAGGGEAINQMAAVLGATLAGIDKSDQDGHNWVLMQKQYYNEVAGLVLNNVGRGPYTGHTFWYEIFPEVLFYSLVDKYPETAKIKDLTRSGQRMSMEDVMYATANNYYMAAYHMGGKTGSPDFNWTSFDLTTLQPVGNGRWTEPDAAAGIAWLEYMAYVKFGDDKFLQAADWGMQFLDALDYNPFYEVLLPYGAYLAARMNAELGRDYDVNKLVNWSFGPSEARKGWGAIAEKWGDCDAYGLFGSVTDGGGYAFAMNTFEAAGSLVPLVRYDSRYARAIGKWMLNLANNARLFYSKYHPADRQSSSFWKEDPESVIAYEGLRKQWEGKSPYGTGDAIRGGGGPTDLGLYGSSHVGILAGLIERTNDEKILQLDLLATDYFHDKAYPTYLYYNPYDVTKTVEIDVGTEPKDLYETTTKRFIATGVSGTTTFDIPADSAAVIVLAPAGGRLEYAGDKTLVDGVVVDYHSAAVAIQSPRNDSVIHGQFPVQIGRAFAPGFELEELIVKLDGEPIYNGPTFPADLALATDQYADESLHSLSIMARFQGGTVLTDSVHFTIDNRILVKAGADDLSNWSPWPSAPGGVITKNTMVSITEDNRDGDRGAVVSPPIELDFGQKPILVIDGIYPRNEWFLEAVISDSNGKERTVVLQEPTSASGKITLDLTDVMQRARMVEDEPGLVDAILVETMPTIQLVLGTKGEGSRVSLFRDSLKIDYSQQ